MRSRSLPTFCHEKASVRSSSSVKNAAETLDPSDQSRSVTRSQSPLRPEPSKGHPPKSMGGELLGQLASESAQGAVAAVERQSLQREDAGGTHTRRARELVILCVYVLRTLR